MSKLLASRIWKRITRLVQGQPGRCQVAAAYLGKDASAILPLRKGSTLIVDMSMAAVKAGQTSPKEVLTLINQGVDDHSVENLHAKVFVIGKQAVVGSNNASRASADEGLIEAAVQTSERGVVADCRRFVGSLRGEIVGAEDARLMERHYRTPRFGRGRRGQGKNDRAIPEHPREWVVTLKLEKWDKEDLRAEKRGRPKARHRLRSANRFKATDFCWENGDFIRRAKRRDLLAQVTKEGQNRLMVAPPARLLLVQRYKKERRACAIFFLETPRGVRQKNLARVVQKVGPWGKELAEYGKPSILQGPAQVHKFLNLWPSGRPT